MSREGFQSLAEHWQRWRWSHTDWQIVPDSRTCDCECPTVESRQFDGCISVTWSKWISISWCLRFSLGDVVELWQWSILPPHLVVVVNGLHCLLNVARQSLYTVSPMTDVYDCIHLFPTVPQVFSIRVLTAISRQTWYSLCFLPPLVTDKNLEQLSKGWMHSQGSFTPDAICCTVLSWVNT